jgi:hypothetical protein
MKKPQIRLENLLRLFKNDFNFGCYGSRKPGGIQEEEKRDEEATD